MFDRVRIVGLHDTEKVFSYGTIHRLLRKRGTKPEVFLRVEIELRDEKRSRFKNYELTLVSGSLNKIYGCSQEKNHGRTSQD